MARPVPRELTMDEFDDWSARKTQLDAANRSADEGGGPALSLVPVEERELAWPTDLITLGARPAATDDDAIPAVTGYARTGTGDRADDSANDYLPAPSPIDGVELVPSRNRFAGWSAERQGMFLAALAETGSVHLASGEARLSARSAYALRTRSRPFADAWDTAIQLSVGRLTAIVMDRAINGRIEQVYSSGELVGERRVPNDRLLTWLLARLDPKRFALPWEQRGDADPQAAAVAAFPGLLDDLSDVVS